MRKFKKLYSPKEFSKITDLPLTTIYWWLRSGKIDTIQKVKEGKHFIPDYEIPAFIRKGVGMGEKSI